ncbi:hypothetical protein [uncultured Paracoccus sp.]|uniref:hypothetical protein n=1 Tax=uncultured Paracoccus sp. TaxID=189685 RepID=UPI0025DEC202|nr:hypothetical protein [uncultured Paracoccus sp.]
MSKVAILVQQEKNLPAVANLAKILSLSLGEARSRIAEGKPLYEGLLFMNNHQEVSTRLRSLVTLLEQVEIPFRIFELEEDENFSFAPHDETEIDSETLENILLEWERRQQSY